MSKNIFIIFAPGLGGNHLANIFSFDNNYRTRIENDTYEKNQKNAHVKLQNIDLKSMRENFDQLVGRNNVFCGHWSEYVYFKESDLNQHFQNRSFCVIQPPQKNSPFYHRLLHVTLPYHNKGTDPWLISEFIMLYKRENITKLINEVESHFVYIQPEMLIDKNIKELVNYVNNQGLNIHPDIEKAQACHNLWLSKNFPETS